MQFNKFIVLTTLLSILTTHILLADAYDSISTSRPGAANPTSSVPTGLYQFEMGTNLSTSPGADTTFTIPALIRMGILKNTELQVAYASQYLTLGVLYGGISFVDGLENSIMTSTTNKISLLYKNQGISHYSLAISQIIELNI